jgi:hypothetical protein
VKQRRALKHEIEANLELGQFLQVRPYTVVEVYARLSKRNYRGVGMAECGRGDVWQEGVESLGYKVALGRAIHVIVEQIEREEEAQEAEIDAIADAARFLRSKGIATCPGK